MISEGSCDTKDCCKDAENTVLTSEKNYILLNKKICTIISYYNFCCILLCLG